MKPAGLLPLLLLYGAAEAPPAPAPVPASVQLTHYYRENPGAEVEAALAEARSGGRKAILVFGADWCGDSRALAAILSSDTFRVRFGNRFSVTFIDVGHPVDGQGRNLDLIARFGIDKMTGTPEVLAIGREGKPLNTLADAHSWHDAADRSTRAIFKWLDALDLPPAG